MEGIGKGEMFWKLYVSMTLPPLPLYCEITGFSAGETCEEVTAKFRWYFAKYMYIGRMLRDHSMIWMVINTHRLRMATHRAHSCGPVLCFDGLKKLIDEFRGGWAVMDHPGCCVIMIRACVAVAIPASESQCK